MAEYTDSGGMLCSCFNNRCHAVQKHHYVMATLTMPWTWSTRTVSYLSPTTFWWTTIIIQQLQQLGIKWLCWRAVKIVIETLLKLLLLVWSY